ncbi:MAG: hypothetical protein CLLPBCKN_001666 [Chroococcidiopsis cubana SAG 39.79]|nr:hypothetical protein [Chroococcidiopsis cubana SAG 39.79]
MLQILPEIVVGQGLYLITTSISLPKFIHPQSLLVIAIGIA